MCVCMCARVHRSGDVVSPAGTNAFPQFPSGTENEHDPLRHLNGSHLSEGKITEMFHKVTGIAWSCKIYGSYCSIHFRSHRVDITVLLT